MNVKPGDLAKVVSVSSDALSGNIGAVVLVESYCFAAPDIYRGEGPWVYVEALEPIKVWKKEEGLVITPAGSKSILCEDRHLRKIEPPGDWESLWETEKKDEEIRV